MITFLTALGGGLVALLAQLIIERIRVGDGYRKIVYEKVVEAITAVHEAYSKQRSFYACCIGPDGCNPRDSYELFEIHNQIWNALSRFSLYYPRDLNRKLMNASAYYCKILDADFNYKIAEELHEKYLKGASSKIDFQGTELLNLGYTAENEEQISFRHPHS